MSERFSDLLDDWNDEFVVIVGRFIDVLKPMVWQRHERGKWMTSIIDEWQIHLIEGDEDEDFTYGALCAALAQLGGYEHEWLLVREFGSYYSLRHTDVAESLTNVE